MNRLAAFWECLERDDFDRFSKLLKSLTDINFIEDGESLLGYISRLIPEEDGSRHLKFVDYLLQAGANPNVSDSFGRSPMSNFARSDHLDYIKLLERSGANLAYRSEPGSTALQEAIRVNCSRRVAEYLLTHHSTVLNDEEKDRLLEVAHRSQARASLALLRSFGIKH